MVGMVGVALVVGVEDVVEVVLSEVEDGVTVISLVDTMIMGS